MKEGRKLYNHPAVRPLTVLGIIGESIKTNPATVIQKTSGANRSQNR
jgi:hypothetical protein